MSKVYEGKLCVPMNVYRKRALKDVSLMLRSGRTLFPRCWCYSLLHGLHLREVKDISVAASPAEVISHLGCTLPAL